MISNEYRRVAPAMQKQIPPCANNYWRLSGFAMLEKMGFLSSSIVTPIFVLLCSSSLIADTLFLKSGRTIDGTVVAQDANYISIETGQGNKRIAKKDIKRIRYSSPASEVKNLDQDSEKRNREEKMARQRKLDQQEAARRAADKERKIAEQKDFENRMARLSEMTTEPADSVAVAAQYRRRLQREQREREEKERTLAARREEERRLAQEKKAAEEKRIKDERERVALLRQKQESEKEKELKKLERKEEKKPEKKPEPTEKEITTQVRKPERENDKEIPLNVTGTQVRPESVSGLFWKAILLGGDYKSNVEKRLKDKASYDNLLGAYGVAGAFSDHSYSALLLNAGYHVNRIRFWMEASELDTRPTRESLTFVNSTNNGFAFQGVVYDRVTSQKFYRSDIDFLGSYEILENLQIIGGIRGVEIGGTGERMGFSLVSVSVGAQQVPVSALNIGLNLSALTKVSGLAFGVSKQFDFDRFFVRGRMMADSMRGLFSFKSESISINSNASGSYVNAREDSRVKARELCLGIEFGYPINRISVVGGIEVSRANYAYYAIKPFAISSSQNPAQHLVINTVQRIVYSGIRTYSERIRGARLGIEARF